MVMTPGGKIEIEVVPIGSVRPNEWNPNVLPSRRYAHLRKELVRVGFAAPLVVSRDGTIINGEHRWRAAGEEGFSEVPVVRLDVDEATAKTISLNLNSIHGEFDKARLAMLVAGLEIDIPKDDLLEILDYTDREMAALMDPPPPKDKAGGGGAGEECECPRCGHRFVEGQDSGVDIDGGGGDGHGGAGGAVEDHGPNQGEGHGA